MFFVFARDEFDSYKHWQNKINIVDVKLIDFGNMDIIEVEERDTGYIHGLKEVIRLLNDMMCVINKNDIKEVKMGIQ